MNSKESKKTIYRILDANLNRLREALRVIEEYYRFVKNDENISLELKKLRHFVSEIEKSLSINKLLENRDTQNDCFADKNTKEEMQRTSIDDVICANFKRAQEAARVIEEYVKLSETPEISIKAKTIRFSLYNLEKEYKL